MSRIALIVQLRAAAGKRDVLLGFARRQARNTVENEEGCLHFDVLVPRDSDDRIVLYEIYRDEAALDLHRKQPYSVKYFEETAALVAERSPALHELAGE